MPRLQTTSQVSFDELLYRVEQLNLPDQFVSRTLALLARRKAPGSTEQAYVSFPKKEAALLLKINQGFSLREEKRYDELTAKRRELTITQEELNELFCLIDRIEKSDAERIKNLAQLAHLRQTSLTALMNDLGIQTVSYA
jgi:hypothetical protein